MSRKTYVIIYGEGGHQEEMKRLLKHGLFQKDDGVNLIAFTDSNAPIQHLEIKNYKFFEFRDKHSWWKTLIKFPWNALRLVVLSFWMLLKHDLEGCVTTGPGLSIIPIIIFRIFRVKVIAFESWAMFYRPSLSGRVLYKLSCLFFIQHITLKNIYKKSTFMGRL